MENLDLRQASTVWCCDAFNPDTRLGVPDDPVLINRAINESSQLMEN